MFQQPPPSSQSTSTPPHTHTQAPASENLHNQHLATLTQLSFELSSQKNRGQEKAEQGSKSSWRSWSDDEHVLLSALFRDLGPSWQQIAVRFQKRQSGQIKRHFYASLKKIYEHLAPTVEHHSAHSKFKNIEFKDFKKIVDQMRREKYRSQQTYTHSRSVIATMLAAQRTHHESCLEEDLQLFKQDLLKVKAMLSKRHSHASTATIEKEQLQMESNKIEQGYLSDSSSVFQQELIVSEERYQIPSLNQFKEDQFFLENMSIAQTAREMVVVEQEEDRIRDLLSREGLLSFVDEQNDNVPQWNGDGLQKVEVVGDERLLISDDNLQIDSHHYFCTIDVIETNQASYKVRYVGVRPYATAPNNTDLPQ